MSLFERPHCHLLVVECWSLDQHACWVIHSQVDSTHFPTLFANKHQGYFVISKSIWTFNTNFGLFLFLKHNQSVWASCFTCTDALYWAMTRTHGFTFSDCVVIWSCRITNYKKQFKKKPLMTKSEKIKVSFPAYQGASLQPVLHSNTMIITRKETTSCFAFNAELKRRHDWLRIHRSRFTSLLCMQINTLDVMIITQRKE